MPGSREPGEGGNSLRLLREELKRRVEPELYETWCRELSFSEEGGAVTIPVANHRCQALFERELRGPIAESFARVFGRAPEIRFTISEPAPEPAPPPAAAAPVPAPAPPRIDGLRLNEHYTFDHFVVGPSNRLAHAAAMAVSEKPGTMYNPLFIHGSVGLGKTHLLQAVCHAMITRNPYASVTYVPCETFVNEYIEAVRRKEPEAFRRRYRSFDLLVVDDIHFLANKEGSQEEFFNTYNALHIGGKQVVLSSDSPPKNIPMLEERLVSRFASGMVAPVEPPTFEERVAIINNKALERGHALPPEVAHFMAESVQSNIRELEGAVNRVLGLASLAGRPVTTSLAEEILKDLVEHRTTTAGIPDIQRVVAEYYHIKPGDMHSRRGTRSTSVARQVAIYLARTLTNHSLKEIGGHFGGKDHTTMLYAIRKIEQWIKEDARARADVDYLARLIRSRLG